MYPLLFMYLLLSALQVVISQKGVEERGYIKYIYLQFNINYGWDGQMLEKARLLIMKFKIEFVMFTDL